MGLIQLTGFETGTTHTEAQASSGTFSFVTSPVHDTSTYALRCNPTTTAVGYVGVGTESSTGTISPGFSESILCATFYFRYAVKPAADSEEFFVMLNDSDVPVLILRLDSAGKVNVYDSIQTLVATGTTVLAQDTWYRIDIAGDNFNSTYELKIDTVAELSGELTYPSGNFSSVRCGKTVNRNGQTVDFFYDNLWLDNAAFVEDIRVASSVPIANGSTMAWTAGTGGSNYAEIDERPISDADYIMTTATTNEIALFTFSSCSTMGLSADDTILVVQGRYSRNENTSVTSSSQVLMKSGATTSASGSRNLTTTPQGASWWSDVDPATSLAWQQSAVDTVELGIRENNAVAVRCSGIVLTVAYVPAPSPVAKPNSLLLGGVG